MKPLLIGMCGLPRSGKTTKAKALRADYIAKGVAAVIVNPDDVRLALHGQRYVQLAEPFVWATVQVAVRALFLSGHEVVIIDATNTSRERRRTWLSKDWRTKWLVVPTSKEECLKRAEHDDLIDVIERMARKLELPGADEGEVEQA